MKPNFWLLKVEKLLHTEDPSLKKESGKHKKKSNLNNQKINFFFETDQLRGGFIPLFFYFYKNKVIINLFFRLSIIKKKIILMRLLFIKII